MSIAQLLLACEKEGLTPEYRTGSTTPIAFNAGNAEVFVVSDFHTGAGVDSSGVYSGTENFFADGSFARFLENAHHSLNGKPGLLVINGDFIDFLRIVNVPRGLDFQRWQDMLASVGIAMDKDALVASISKKEKENYGLKTHDFKSVWKLDVCAHGHPALFAALAEWLKLGQHLVIVKGNHDLEWYWLAVRNYLRLTLAKFINEQTREGVESILKSDVLPRLTFIDDAMIVDNELYIEHGHRYDKFSNVQGGPLWGSKELNIPFGSFINRYLLNNLEMIYPFLDNVRPSGNVLHMLMRERFFHGLKVLFKYIPFTFKMIPKRYAHYMLKPLVGYALAIGLPIVLVLFLWGNRLWPLLFPESSTGPQNVGDVALGFLTGILKETALLFLSYLGARFISWVQLEEPSSLFRDAEKLFSKFPHCRFFTMGHTHNPEQHQIDQWYVNSSTWIPVIEASSAALREDRTYAVVQFGRESNGLLKSSPLQRWNDDANRLEPLPIVVRD
ncbi:MAG TPA: hypothetical protein VGB89_15190 [Bacteroidota bacterium]